MIRQAIALVAAMLVLSDTAAANDRRLYVGLLGGPSWQNETDLTTVGGLDAELERETGWVAGLHAGVKDGLWRYELEYAFRRNAFSEIEFNNPGPFIAPAETSAQGLGRSHSIMANIHREVFSHEGWKAILGIGLGVTQLNVDSLGAAGQIIIDDGDWEAAGQAMAQVARQIGDNAEVALGYRYFRSRRNDFTTTVAGPASFRFQNHEVFARLTWLFGEDKAKPKKERVTPPPPPPPAPKPVTKPKPAPKPVAPQPKPIPQVAPGETPIPGPYKVYFAFDSSDLDRVATGIIDDAAAAYKEYSFVDVESRGHTDRAGSNAYNDALSLRRAEAVRDALVARGVPAGKIRVLSFGEGDNEVSTPDGVREDGNRRVEIRLER